MSVKAIIRTIAGAPDYETGTWTPVLEGTTVAGSHTYANQGGSFVKFGNLVWATGIVALSAFDPATSGSMLITGLPYPGASGSHNSSAFSIARFQNVNLDAANGYFFATLQVPGGDGSLQLIQFGDNVMDKSIFAVDMASNTALRCSGVYVTGVGSVG